MCPDLETMAYALGQLQFHGVEIGTSLIKHSPDRTEMSVNRIQWAAIIRIGGSVTNGQTYPAEVFVEERGWPRPHGRADGRHESRRTRPSLPRSE